MAQLPPKIPTIPQNWQHFSHQRVSSSSTMSNITSTTTTTTDHQQIPSWIDEFLDFSSVRRGAHRRSASDSIAFLETSFLEEDGKSGGGDGDGDFDRLDDEQLLSMFSDNVGGGVSFPPPSTSNPSSPSSDQNSNNHEEKPMAMVLDSAPVHERYLCHEVKPKDEAVEDESSCRIEEEGAAAAPSFAATISCTETVVDPKRVKRILANRQSAQRSRVRKLQYISELERSVTSLQTEVSALSPRVAFLDHQRLILNVDNSALKQRIAALAQDKLFKDAHQEALKKEIERLRQIYHQQNIQKMENSINNNNNNNGHSLQSPPTSQPQQHSFHNHLECKDKEQLLS
ncbi:basic leucine zipper 34-like [Vicia villosa]|uniref:basic leucine zipper 34-like n=1 Tax=Vicia villosa TaxID=3911 RepID=UPI00273C302A|nr:basic leucine zipper 34-like [Vicia villosa]